MNAVLISRIIGLVIFATIGFFSGTTIHQYLLRSGNKHLS